MKRTMKFLLAALAIATASADTFVCNEACAELFYTHLAAQNFETHGLDAVDAGVYAYIVYNNFAATNGANIDLTDAFMEGVGLYCELTETWKRKDLADCFANAECEGENGVEAAQTGYTDCDAANDNGCTRIMGLMVNQFGGPKCFTDAFPSELTTAEKIEGAKIFTVFMAVVGNWNAMGAACQGKILEASGYSANDDVVLTIASKADEIIEGTKVEECGYKDGAWDVDNADAATAAIAVAGKKTFDDTTAAQVEVAKLETKINDDAAAEASPAAMLSAAVAAIAMLL